MKKIICTIVSFALIFSGVFSSDIFAYSAPSEIRVGLTYKYKEASTVPIVNKAINVGYEADGQFVKSASLTASSAFSMVCANLYYLKIENTGGDYQTAKTQAASITESKDLKAAPCLSGLNSWAVCVGGFNSQANALAAQASIPLKSTIIAPDSRRTALLDGTDIAVLFDSANYYPQIEDVIGDAMKLGDGARSFRGRIEFGRYKGANLTAVNVLSLDQYLYSVVPSEMPSSWHKEALQAQACAARSYAVSNINKHKNDGFSLCDSIDCQVYLGLGNEAESTTKAVDATKNTFILYNDEPINAVFFSSSGGMTDDSENVWPNALPYFKSVVEINETTPKVWTRTITLQELNSVLAANKENIGSATGIYIASLNNSGRVGELVIKGTNGSKSLFKEQIRTYFSSLSGGSLESRNFQVYSGAVTSVPTQIYVTNGPNSMESPLSSIIATDSSSVQLPLSSASGNIAVVGSGGSASYSLTTSKVAQFQGEGSNIVISGKGWGHGVGLSQYGAKGMAEMGYSFEDILKYYYTGVDVKRIGE